MVKNSAPEVVRLVKI